MCGAKPARGHHIIKQQVLRYTARQRGLQYERIRWDLRNLLPLCDRCHIRHHSRFRPVPLSVVFMHAPKVLQFARELELDWWLSREYPHHTTRRPR